MPCKDVTLADVLVGFDGDFLPDGALLLSALSTSAIFSTTVSLLACVSVMVLRKDAGTAGELAGCDSKDGMCPDGSASEDGDCVVDGCCCCGCGCCDTGGGAGGGVVTFVGDTMAAVRAMLCDDEVNAAVHGDAPMLSDSSSGFGTCGSIDCGVGKGAPNGGGNGDG